MSPPITLLALCGCPGSGKSTFARYLVEKLGASANVYSISFDAIERSFYGE